MLEEGGGAPSLDSKNTSRQGSAIGFIISFTPVLSVKLKMVQVHACLLILVILMNEFSLILLLIMSYRTFIPVKYQGSIG